METFQDIQKINSESLAFLETAGFKFYTTILTEELNEKDGKKVPKKKFIPPTGWDTIDVMKNTRDSKTNKPINTWCVNTQKTGLTVIDLDAVYNDYADDLQKSINKAIYEGLKDECNFIVKTKKGLHMYFKTDKLYYNQKINYNIGGFDVLTKNKNEKGNTVFGFGSSYTDAVDCTKIHFYKLIKGGDLNNVNQINIYNDEIHEKFMNILKAVNTDAYNYVYNYLIKDDCIYEESKEESKEEEPKKEKPKRNKTVIIDDDNDYDYENVSDVEIYMNIMDSIKLKRFETYQEWLILQCIHKKYGIPYNVYDGYNRLIKNYSEENNKKIIDGLKPEIYNAYSFGTLFYYLKMDDPNGFYRLACVNTVLIQLFINFNFIEIAEYFYNHNKDLFIYIRTDDKFYAYNKYNILEEQYEDIISKTIYNFFSNVIKQMKISKKYKKIADKFMTRLSDTGRNILKVVNLIKSNYEISKDVMDSKFNIVPFKNGVCYDFNIKEIRNIEKTDYVSIYTNLDYRKDIKYSIIQDVNNYIKNMFQEGSGKYEYVMASIGYAMFYHIKSKCYILSGIGGNGKSQLINMISSAFNNDTKSMISSASNSFFTKNKAGGERPNNTLASAKNTRILSLSEPDETSFDVQFLKSLTSDEEINTRGLYASKNTIYKPRFTVFLSCNNFPNINETNNAIERRLTNINFCYNFKDKDKITEPNDKVADKEFFDKFNQSDDYKLAFINLVFEYMEDNIKNNYYVPQIIKDETECFFMEQKHITTFLNRAQHFQDMDRIIRTENNRDFIRVSELMKLYNNFEDTTIKMNSREFNKQLLQEKFRISLIDGYKCIRGYKIDDLDI
jgi:phage/plasmid-associated DNA primase